MINRRALVCISCGTKVITRTAIGHGDKQEHKFSCPKCGVEISYTLFIDQKNVDFSYSEPNNGKWVEDEEEASQVLSFDAESPVPADLPDWISPFTATIFYLKDIKAYSRDEMLRRVWLKKHWPVIKRMIVHFERGNDVLFDKDAKLIGHVPASSTRKGRLDLLGTLQMQAFNWFTDNTRGQFSRITQRIALAKSISGRLYAQLAKEYLTSGRISLLWTQINSIRDGFATLYPFFSPLIKMRYWHEHFQDLSQFKLAEKKYDEMKQLYIDCYETLCRLLVIGIGGESIIHHGNLAIPTSKGTMTIEDFESMPNGKKPDILKKYPIADLFIDVMDSKLRNGIGHHSANYDIETDTVIYYEIKGSNKTERQLSYTEFCDRIIKLFSAIELAIIYFHELYLKSLDS
jgi:DNA-directed RNA polymerase subunit RPC12/RpoP